MTCKKAMDVANEMKKKYGEYLEVNFYPTDSEQAKKYHFRSATNVLFNDELLPIETATDREKLDRFLAEKIHAHGEKK